MVGARWLSVAVVGLSVIVPPALPCPISASSDPDAASDDCWTRDSGWPLRLSGRNDDIDAVGGGEAVALAGNSDFRFFEIDEDDSEYVPRRSVDYEDKIDQEALTLKEMAFEQALIMQGRSSGDRGSASFCDQFIPREEFYIHSPAYPNNYPANLTCRYQIYRRHPDYCGVAFTVLRLDLAQPHPAVLAADDSSRNNMVEGRGQQNRTCGGGDVLLIEDVVHCGRYQRGKTATFSFPGTLLTVEFRSGANHGASGFLLLGRQVKTCRTPRTLGSPLTSSVQCDRMIDSSMFLLTSPEYPAPYRHNAECHFAVRRLEPDACGVQLTVKDFDLEESGCMFDYVEVQGQRLCGSLEQGFSRYFRFEGNELDIRFRTDESTRRKGFSIAGQQVLCRQARPIQAPLSQARPSKADDAQLGVEARAPDPPETTLAPLGPFPLPPSRSTQRRHPISTRPPLGRDSTEGFLEDAKEEENFTELEPGLISTTTVEAETTNSEQNVPGDPDFNPFTTNGLPPTIPTTIPGLTPTNPTTIDYPTTFTNIFPTTFTNTFPTTEIEFPTTSLAGTECDQFFVDVSFSISSPGYPGPYPNSVDCAYVVGRASLDVCAVSGFDIRNGSSQRGIHA
ncbi:Cubilin [Penaeus vannamei]|uniref:Cubilin n=1 Tax=Penaeus vannamei TaxID=6689 RepID=A0A423U3N6_PENVA|nr:Cubilin [Penaeus vannamei]